MLLVLSTGEKGGSGKSLLAWVLASYFHSKKWRWKGVDIDKANQQFATLGEDKVQGFTLQDDNLEVDPRQVTAFANYVGGAMEAGELDAIVVDVGAGQLGLIRGALRETGLEDFIGRKLTLVVVYTIVSNRQSVSTLVNNMTILDGTEGAHWLIVRNAYKGPLADYDKSTTLRPHLLKAGATEIDIEKIRDESILDAWMNSGEVLGVFLTQSRDWAVRQKLTTWADKIYAQLDSFAVFEQVKVKQ
jgi:hypothetical protein